MRNQKLLYNIVLFLLKYSEAARILCYQAVPFNSHHKALDIITAELAQQGHQLVVITALPREAPIQNITEIDIHDITYSMWEKGNKEAKQHLTTYTFPDSNEVIHRIITTLRPIVERQFSHPRVQALINDETQRFDLIIVESSVMIGHLFSARFQAPLLVISPLTVVTRIFSLVGATTDDYFFPSLDAIIPQGDFSFRERLYYFYKRGSRTLTKNTANYQNVLAKPINIGQLFLPSNNVKEHVDMLFLDVHRFWDNNRPVPIGSVLYLDGLHLKTPESLPQDLKTFVDNSKHGVVLMNLGTIAKSSELPAHALRVIINVFSQLPYDFIWKWDAEDTPGRPKNVRFEKSVPQNDLLYHPNVRAFITHCGLLSTHEAMSARVPLVGLPVTADHWLNSHQYEKHGIGIKLDIDSLQEGDFRDAIVAVIEDKKFRDNMGRLSRIMRERRESALRAATWQAQLLLRPRAARLLRCARADATAVQFYMLDLLLVATICVLVVAIAIVFIVKRIIRIAVTLISKVIIRT